MKPLVAVIAQLCPSSGTRTPLNQYLVEGLNLRPFLQNVYKSLLRNQEAFFMIRLGMSVGAGCNSFHIQ